jgi:glycosyltransferase involved in cell wall biosynthesis
LYFGNIAPWKGFEVLIRSAKVVRTQVGKEFNLVIRKPYKEYQNISFFKVLRKQFEICQNSWQVQQALKFLILQKNSLFLVLPYNDMSKLSASEAVPLAYTFSKPVIVSSFFLLPNKRTMAHGLYI